MPSLYNTKGSNPMRNYGAVSAVGAGTNSAADGGTAASAVSSTAPDELQYYLGKGSGQQENVTCRNRVRQYSLVLIPLVVAAMIIVGWGYVFADSVFGGHADKNVRGIDRVVASENSPIQGLGVVAHDRAACAVNDKCQALNLTGTCCPTNDGVTLDCCNK